MPSDSIISYWKPEVSIKLVNDFSKYPIHHGKLLYMQMYEHISAVTILT